MQMNATRFRATAIARIVAKYPSRANELRSAVAASSAAERPSAAEVSSATEAPSYAAFAATSSAAFALTSAFTPAPASASSSASSSAYYAASSADSAAPAIWLAVSDDAASIEVGISARDLAEQPLWPNGVPPDWALKHWGDMRAALPKADGWDVWIKWYEDRLKGVSVSEEVELAYTTVSQKKWDEGPAAANAWIKEQLEKLKPKRKARVPAQEPAAIEPVVRGGKITLPTTAAKAELDARALNASLKALRAHIGELAHDLEGEANIDKRVIAMLHQLHDRIPTKRPTQERLFLLAHQQESLELYGNTVAAEWPDLLAGRYLGAFRAFDRTMRQFPEWRKFKQNADKNRLNDEQRAAAPILGARLAAALSEDEASKRVDAAVPTVLQEMAKGLEQPSGEASPVDAAGGANSLAEDLVTSSENVVKRIAESALQADSETTKKKDKAYAKKLAEGFIKGMKDGEKDGEELAKWAKKALIKGAAGGVGLGVAIAELMEKYPHIAEWLRPIIDHLSH